VPFLFCSLFLCRLKLLSDLLLNLPLHTIDQFNV